MKFFIKIIPFLSLSLLLTSCNLTPASFWTNFEKQCIVQNKSDQGPWGGYRAIQWKARDHFSFSSRDAIAYATKHGWELVDSTFYCKDSIVNWEYNHELIFPLDHEGFNPTMTHISSIYAYFPRRTNSNITVYGFTTGFVAINPGTNEANHKNGFIIINDDSSEMCLYHLWGE